MIVEGDRVLARSRSLWTDDLPLVDVSGGEMHVIAGPNGQRLRAFARSVPIARLSRQLAVIVAAPAAIPATDVRWAVSDLAAILIGIGLASVALAVLMINRGLAPLRSVAQDVSRLSRGDIERIQPTGYRELDPLVEAVNGLAEDVNEVVARSRLHTSNLAHALKTPLSLLATRMRTVAPNDEAISEGIDALNRQIDHHLKRVRFAPKASTIRASIPVEPVIDDVLLVMQRMHVERGIHVEKSIAAGATLFGEREDFQELIGNIVENAYKWARSRVAIDVWHTERETGVEVSDDGPGLDAASYELVLRPGARLDETVPGSGLGLTIAAELTRHYGGAITLGESRFGGLLVTLRFPIPAAA